MSLTGRDTEQSAGQWPEKQSEPQLVMEIGSHAPLGPTLPAGPRGHFFCFIFYFLGSGSVYVALTGLELAM